MFTQLLPELKRIQGEEGFLSEESLRELSVREDIPLVKIYEVATFYSFLSTSRRGKYVIRVCNSPSCLLSGSDAARELFENELGISCGETTSDGMFTLEWTACIGCCDESPAALVGDQAYTRLTAEKVREIIKHASDNKDRVQRP